jgi:glycosyltransferase involved in cell wall biosynthesis
MQPKVLMIAYTNYSTDARVQKEAEALVSRRMPVDFICLKEKDNGPKSTVNGVKFYYVPVIRYRGERKFSYILSYLSFFFLVQLYSTVLYFKNRYKVVHVNNMPDFLVFAAIIPKLFGAKIILDIHDPLPITFLTKFNLSKSSLFYKLLIWEERLSAKFADKIITAHSLLKDEVLQNDGISKKKIDDILNFADEKKFKFINNYNINGKLRLIYHGTIAERFGLKKIIEVMKDLNEVDFDFTIIGSGDYSTEITSIIKKLNLENRINFINESFPVNKLPEILKEFNLGIVTYELSTATEYMLPVKFLELISLGIPSIVVKNKVISHYFTEEDAFFYDNSEPDSLIKIIANISKKKNLLFEKRNRLLEIREKYFWSTEAQKYYEIVQNLIGEN